MVTCAMESALNEYLDSFVECTCNYVEDGYDECRCEEIANESIDCEYEAERDQEYWAGYYDN